MFHKVNEKEQVSKVIWQKAASPKFSNRIRPILPPSNTGFLGPTRISTLNGISIGSFVFALYISVTNTQTHRPRCV